MIHFDNEDTIVALSTPFGRGAISVVRLSGKNCLSIVNRIFSKEITPENHRQAITGILQSGPKNLPVDQVVTTFFHSPKSYTGEDVVEISCHGNPIIVEQIIRLCIMNGARPASPGEFTQRAFLNHKLDLAQAEAVANIINARTQQSILYSMRQLDGKLSQKIENIKQNLIDLLSQIEVSLDFNEGDVEIYEKKTMLQETEETLSEIDTLLHSYQYGKLLNEGVKLVILGKPNVGKSSLLNALLEKERAIVSDIPGTTRDYIEAQIHIDGIPIQVVDTAGVRKTSDPIEKIGVEKALNHIQTSDIVLAIFEAHKELTEDDRRLIKHLTVPVLRMPLLVLLNKVDLGSNKKTVTQFEKLKFNTLAVSALRGDNLPELKKCIKKRLHSDALSGQEEIVLTNARHYIALKTTRQSLEMFYQNLIQDVEEVILAADLKSAITSLGIIVGETTPEDVLNHIFSSFCIGK